MFRLPPKKTNRFLRSLALLHSARLAQPFRFKTEPIQFHKPHTGHDQFPALASDRSDIIKHAYRFYKNQLGVI